MTRRSVGVGARWLALLLLSSFAVGCATLLRPAKPLAAGDFDVTGRMRIKAEDTILRLDFHLMQENNGVQLQLWGPLGIHRTKITFRPDGYLIEDRHGQVLKLDPGHLPAEIPRSVWQIGPNLGSWLRIQPKGVNRAQALTGWFLKEVRVLVEATQIVHGEIVCKRMRMSSGGVEVLVLCDRWRVTP